MSLSDSLAALQTQAVILEGALVEAGLAAAAKDVEIASLKVALADCQGTPDPDPDPDPDPIPGPQPPDGHYVALGDDVNKAINSHPAGSTFVFEPGERKLSEPLARKAGNRYWSDGAMFVGPGAGGVPFLPLTAGLNGLVLQGIGAKYFGPANADQGAGMIDFQGGTNLLLEDCDFGFSNRSVVSGHGSWDMVRTYVHHGGKYSVQGAFGLIEDCEWSHSGRKDIPGVAPWTSSNDKGGSKFVLSDGLRVIRLYTHDHGWTGFWCDIQNENIYLEDVRSEDNVRHGISIEVSYGPATIIRPRVKRCGTEAGKKSGETDVPVPAGILISMSPDVTVIDPQVEDCYNGIMVRQWNHPQVIGTVGNADRSKLGVENISIEGGFVKNSKQFDAGVHGPHIAGTRPTRNIHWNDVDFDVDAKFTSALHVG